MKIGFIGLGAMGTPMAAHLIAAGHQVFVWARRAQSATTLLRLGARWCASPRALGSGQDDGAGCEVVMSMVTTGADVEAIVRGPQDVADGLAAGLAAGLAPGSIHIDLSTIPPQTAQRLADDYRKQGVGWIDAPVSGGVAGAQAGSLAIMAGGEASDFARVEPLLRCLGKTVLHIGPAGAGQTAKICNQMIMVAAIEACAEALQLAQANGLDLGRVHQALLGGSAQSRVLEVMGERMLHGQYQDGVEARLHHKDFAIVLEAAHQLGAPVPISAQVAQRLNTLMATGGARLDTAALFAH